MQPRPPGAWNGQFTIGPSGVMTSPMGASAAHSSVWPSMPTWQPMGLQMQMQQQYHIQQQMQLANMQHMHLQQQQQQQQLMQQQQMASWNSMTPNNTVANTQPQQASDKSTQHQQNHQQKQYHFAGRKRSHEGANTNSKPLSNKAAKRAAALAPLVPQGPVVVRAPATAAEAAEVEAWKAERRKNWPSTTNVAKKATEASKLAASGALDPQSNNRTALAAVLQKQRALGLAKAAGTADMCVHSDGSIAVAADGAEEGFGGGWGRGFNRGRGGWGSRNRGVSGFTRGRGHRGGRGWGRGRFEATEFSEDANGNMKVEHRQNADQQQQGDSTAEAAAGEGKPGVDAAAVEPLQHQQQYQGFRRGTRGGRVSGRGRGGRHVAFSNNHSHHGHSYDSRYGAGTAAGRGGYRPQPRRPCLLEALLSVDIRREASWLLQAIRFLVMNNFLQPVDNSTAATAHKTQQAEHHTEATEAAADVEDWQLEAPAETGDPSAGQRSAMKGDNASSSEPHCSEAADAAAAAEQQQPVVGPLGLQLRFPEEVLLHQPLAQLLAAQPAVAEEEDVSDDDHNAFDDDDNDDNPAEQNQLFTVSEAADHSKQQRAPAVEDEEHDKAVTPAGADDNERYDVEDSDSGGLEGLLEGSDTELYDLHHLQQQEPASVLDGGSSNSNTSSSDTEGSGDDSLEGNDVSSHADAPTAKAGCSDHCA